MNAIIHPTYLPNIASFVAMTNASHVLFEAEDNYQKQTYRNRSCIYAANGKLALHIPINHSQKERQKYKDVKIANDENWQDLHWKSIQSAYRTSPFFEHYETDIAPLFQTKKEGLFDFNIACIETIAACIDMDINATKTSKFVKEYQHEKDYRYLVKAKKETQVNLEPYIQVFGTKHGFIPNLSILDLLFNEGPNAITYLESQTL